MKIMKPVVGYYRESTLGQKDGLGFDAQYYSVHAFASANNMILIKEFTEIESGRRNKRPVINEAIAFCKQHNATLLIASLDRLARGVLFIEMLRASKIKFIAVNKPEAGKLELQLTAVIDENESDRISVRTKQALAAAKRRGVQLGVFGKEVLSKLNHEMSIKFATRMRDTIVQLNREGYYSLRKIANQLNLRGVPTYHNNGYRWHPATVHKVLTILKQSNLLN